jgi:REP element-mobilizing transposase RayT
VEDRHRFLGTLTEACGKTEWQIHAYCLMRNHFHLAIETPQPNLVFGMKWLLGTCMTRGVLMPIQRQLEQRCRDVGL